MKKILFYTDTPLIGGAENQMLLLAKFLPKDRFAVTLACSSYQNLNSWCQNFLDNDMNVIRFKVLHKHDPRHFFYLRKILPQFDLVHMHIWNPASGRYGFLASSKIPLVVTEHDPFSLTGLKKWLKEKFAKKIARVIVASEGAKKIVLAEHPSLENRITLIKNGIDDVHWQKESALDSRSEFRRSYFGTTGNEKIILCVAELHERKGQKYLIDAFQQLEKEFPQARLVFVGDGGARNSYERRARRFGKKVMFMGWRKEIAPLMAVADIFVLPSRREAFGLVLLEAGAVWLPVIASNVGGIPEIIQQEKNGLLVEPENADQLADAIRFLLNNPQKALEYAHELRSRVATEFSAATMAQKTADVYDDALTI